MSYESNISEVMIDLSKRLDGFLVDNKVVAKVAQVVWGNNIRRIHNEGNAVNESSIGKYGIKPLYVNPKKSPKKFTPKGKSGESKFKNGKSHKTKYFPKGYKGFRAEIGRRVDKVNLSLSGRLEKEFTLQPRGKDWVVGFSSVEANDLRLALEKKYNKAIWGVSKTDDKVIDEILKNAKVK